MNTCIASLEIDTKTNIETKTTAWELLKYKAVVFILRCINILRRKCIRFLKLRSQKPSILKEIPNENTKQFESTSQGHIKKIIEILICKIRFALAKSKINSIMLAMYLYCKIYKTCNIKFNYTTKNTSLILHLKQMTISPCIRRILYNKLINIAKRICCNMFRTKAIIYAIRNKLRNILMNTINLFRLKFNYKIPIKLKADFKAKHLYNSLTTVVILLIIGNYLYTFIKYKYLNEKTYITKLDNTIDNNQVTTIKPELLHNTKVIRANKTESNTTKSNMRTCSIGVHHMLSSTTQPTRRSTRKASIRDKNGTESREKDNDTTTTSTDSEADTARAVIISRRTGKPVRNYKRSLKAPKVVTNSNNNSKKLKTIEELNRDVKEDINSQMAAFSGSINTPIINSEQNNPNKTTLSTENKKMSQVPSQETQLNSNNQASRPITKMKITIPEDEIEQLDTESDSNYTSTDSSSTDENNDDEESQTPTNRPKLVAKRLCQSRSSNMEIEPQNDAQSAYGNGTSTKPYQTDVFKIMYNTDSTIKHLHFMYNSKILNEAELKTVETAMSKLNANTKLEDDEISKLTVMERKISKLMIQQNKLITDLERIKKEHVFDEQTLTQINQILVEFQRTSLLNETNMLVLTQITETGQKALNKNAQIATLKEIITQNNLNNHEIEAAKTLRDKINGDAELNQNEIEILNTITIKQNQLMLVSLQKDLIHKLHQLSHLALDHMVEIDRLEKLINETTVLSDSDFKKLTLWLKKSTIDETTQAYYNNIYRMLIANKKFESSYPRTKFAIHLTGKGISQFPNTFEDRINEIKRCKPAIKNIIKADLVREIAPGEEYLTEAELMMKIKMNTKENREIQICVTSYEDLMLLMTPWPFDAFKRGVIPHLDPIEELPILFNDVDKHVIFKKDTSSAKKLEQEFGVIELNRIFIKNNSNNPTKTIRAKVLTIKSYVDAMIRGVPISSSIRVAIPQISHGKVCVTCGSIKHFKCDTMPRCFGCGSLEHSTDRCANTIRCINCKRGHRCDSEECELLRRKTYSMNDFAISILLGEGIINHVNKILRDPEAETRSNDVNKEEIEHLVNDMITKNSFIQAIHEKQLTHEKDISVIKTQLTELKEADARIIEAISITNSDVSELKTKLEDNTTELKNEISKSKNEMCAKQDETNNKIAQLIDVFAKISSPSRRRKRDGKH